MRDYGKVHSSFWTSEDTRRLTDDGRSLALYLLTSPHSNMLGCFRLPDAYVAEDTQWSTARIGKAFADLEAAGFAIRDSAKWVTLRKFLRWNPIENPNQGKAAMKLFAQVPDGPAKRALAVAMMTLGSHLDRGALEPFRKGSETVPTGFRNQDQDQEMEQEQEQDAFGEPPAAPAPKPAKPKGPKPATRQPTDDVDPWLAALDVPAVDSALWGPQVAAWLDHHAAKGSRFADWAAAWRTWARNAVKFGHVDADPAKAKRSLQAPPVQRETSPRDPEPNPRLEAHMARMTAEGRTTPMPANPLQALLDIVSKTPTPAPGRLVATSEPPATPREASSPQSHPSAGDQRGAA